MGRSEDWKGSGLVVCVTRPLNGQICSESCAELIAFSFINDIAELKTPKNKLIPMAPFGKKCVKIK